MSRITEMLRIGPQQNSFHTTKDSPMRRFLSAACLVAVFTLVASAHADSYTTLDLNSGTEKNNTDGTFKDYKQSGYFVADRYTDNFVYNSGAVYGGYQEGKLISQDPSTDWNSATVYVGNSSGLDFLLDSFDILYFGDKVTWNVYGYSSKPGTPLGTPLATGTLYSSGTVDLSSYDLPYEYEYGIQLTINSGATGSKAKFGLDNIVVSPTPEPGGIALLGTGLLGVAAALRQRRRAA